MIFLPQWEHFSARYQVCLYGTKEYGGTRVIMCCLRRRVLPARTLFYETLQAASTQYTTVEHDVSPRKLQ